MLIRVATSADVPAMRALDLASNFGARWSDGHYAGLFVAADRQKHLVLVAEEPGEIVAYLAASGVGVEWELENIVAAGHRLRRGIARALMAEFLARLRREAVARVHLEVRESNHAARSLYASLGFTQTGRRANYYAGPAEDAVLLALSL